MEPSSSSPNSPIPLRPISGPVSFLKAVDIAGGDLRVPSSRKGILSLDGKHVVCIIEAFAWTCSLDTWESHRREYLPLKLLPSGDGSVQNGKQA